YGQLMGFANGDAGIGNFVGGTVRVVSADPLGFFVNNNVQAMTIVPSGSIGIGTASPLEAVTLWGASGTGIGIRSAGASDMHYINLTAGSSGLQIANQNNGGANVGS